MEILFIANTPIGDTILSTGLLRHLIARYPGARITVACSAPSAQLFEALPNRRRIVVVRKRAASLHWLELWRACVGTKWDLVVDMKCSAIAWCLRARERRLLPKSKESMHQVERVAMTFDLDPPPAPGLWTGPKHDLAARELLPGDRPTLAVAPVASWIGKTWAPDRFAELVRRLISPQGMFAGGRVLVTGGKGDTARAQAILDAIPERQRVDLLGLDLLTTYAAFRRCRLFIGNDSGLMHLAAAADIPTLGLFGPTHDTCYVPWGPRCAAVRTPESVEELLSPGSRKVIAGSLMMGLSVDAVAEAVDRLARQAP